MPQECGNRTGVRYVSLSSDNNDTVTFTALDKPFELDVLPYSVFELENALHHNELPNVNYTYVTIYKRQMGIGGENSWGAIAHDEFLLDSSIDHEFEFILCKEINCTKCLDSSYE